MGQPGPRIQIPSPAAADIGKGRLPFAHRTAVLERYDGSAWREAGRYGSVRDAGKALDEAIGSGAAPGSVRVVEVGLSTGTRALLIVGGVVLLACFAFAMYALFG